MTLPNLARGELSPSLRLVTLGTPGLWSDDGERVPLAGKTLALLIWLERGVSGAAHRERIADLLWSDTDEPRSRQSLRQALTQLRARLGPDAVTSDGPLVELLQPLWSDADEFERAAANRDFAAASLLYRGEFLERFALPGASEFEHWADLERRRLQGLWSGLLDTRAQALLDSGRAREARSVAAMMRDADPERERSWRLLIESALAMGDVALATADSRAFEEVMREAGRSPDQATVRVLRRVERGAEVSVQPRAPDSLDGDLIGREPEFAQLLKTWQRTRATRGAVRVWLEAPPGLGKTRLLREFNQRLVAAGARCIVERARPGEQDIPLAFASRLVAALGALDGAAGVSPAVASSLVALAPSLGDVYRGAPSESAREDDALRVRAWAVGELLAALAEDRALALLVDDWHWADQASRTLLEGALSRAESVPLLTVISRRAAESVALRGTPDAAAPLRLSAWSSELVRAFVESVASWPGGPPPPELVDRLREVANGSPLLVRQTLELAIEQQRLALAGGEWQVPDVAGLAGWLGALDLAEERTRRLGPAERAVALLIAVAGGPVHVASLAAAAPTIDVPVALRALEQLGWVQRNADVASLTHDTLQQALTEVASPDALRQAQSGIGRGELALGAALDRTGAQRAARLLAAGGDEAGLVRLFSVWCESGSLDATAALPREAAQQLLGPYATPERVALLVRSVPWIARLRSSRWSSKAAAAVLLLLAGWASYGALVGVQPAAVRFVDAPLAISTSAATPTPVVEVVDASGRRVQRDGDTVRLRIAGEGAPWPGSTAVTARGVARFPSFRRPDGDTASLDTIHVVSASLKPDGTIVDFRPRLRVHHGTANAVPFDSLHAEVTVLAGTPITIRVAMRVSTSWGAAAVMHVAAPSWGDPRTSWIELGAVPTPTLGAVLESAFTLPAPPRAGRYFVFLALGPEPESRWIASGTNWKVGRPQWGDGNDLGSWGAGEVRIIRGQLSEFTPRMVKKYPSGRWSERPVADVITINVVPGSQAR